MTTSDLPPILDAHLDLSLNALEWNRDLRLEIDRLREGEASLSDKVDRGHGVVSFPEMRKANTQICVATQIAGCPRTVCPVGAWSSPEQAWAQTQGQLAWYRAMEDLGELSPITTKEELDRHRTRAKQSIREPAIGYVRSLEGADSLRTLNDFETAWNDGLRALGPAHYGPGRYANGTDAEGGFPESGKHLLKLMDEVGCILDVTHLTDACFDEALELYSGPIWASHSNARTLVPHQRQLSDEQIRRLTARGSVIGVVLDAWMLAPDWIRGEANPETMAVSLSTVADHIEHICQISGSATYVGLGTDLDGGFGDEQCPSDVKRYSHLTSLQGILEERGFSATHVRAILFDNFASFLSQALPASA